tara:strand:+ start:2845 stop:3216 length:372 start_codon:yes stop_codon:yes gene_type:complete
MSSRNIEYHNLVSNITDTVSVTLKQSVTPYTAGMIVVNQDDNKYHNELIVLSGASASTPQVSYDAQNVYVLVEDVDASAGDVVAVAYSGTFNRSKISFKSPQTEASVKGILQAKNIILKDWGV